MLIQAIKSRIVSHISYIISSQNEAAVIDPMRDVRVYLEIAAKWEVKIKYIFETHRNEDYVVGSKELAQLTQAKVFHGQGLPWADPARRLSPGRVIDRRDTSRCIR